MRWFSRPIAPAVHGSASGSPRPPFAVQVTAKLCVLIAAWGCAMGSDIALVTQAAACLTLIGAVRLALLVALARAAEGLNRARLSAIEPFTAIGFAACLGLLSAALIVRQAPAASQLLGLAIAACHMTGSTLRASGRPLLTLGQVAVALVPIMLACLMDGSGALLLLALLLPVLIAGVAVAVLAMMRDLEARLDMAEESCAYAEELREQAHTDPVTGLANRAGFECALSVLCDSIALGEKVMLLRLDLKRFAALTHAQGHAMGDDVLRLVAARLGRLLPDHALLARYTGGEFLVALRLTDRAEGETLAAAIAEELAGPVRIGGTLIDAASAAGAAFLPDDALAPGALLEAADLALYHARANDMREVCAYRPGMSRAITRRKEMEAELRAAIQKDELSLFFQPIVDLGTGRISGFEALVRWFHPEKGELYPADFIPVAEESGLIVTLGNWIIATAARAAASWPGNVPVSVNLSPVQIRAPGAAPGILAALRSARLQPSRLTLEVTEHLFAEDDGAIDAFMGELSLAGVTFALDDFGTGAASLGYIHRHPFRAIKVDRSFVSGANSGKRSDAVIRAVAELGATLGMDIVAEGLETIEQVQVVRAAGCTLGQGYFFSRAVPDYQALVLLTEEEEQLRRSDAGPERRLAG